MAEIQRYKILYTQTAVKDLEDKADYISFQLQDPALAQKWYLRLRNLIQGSLTTFPLKYPVYDVEPWKEKGIRLFLTRGDVVLYSVDLEKQVVYIRGICTKGRDLSAHLEETE
nr:type II toxin-antitoxin system RelE/ParE family toxin [uncultured Oscillibacter sp.]